jgi:hypothetical protein
MPPTAAPCPAVLQPPAACARRQGGSLEDHAVVRHSHALHAERLAVAKAGRLGRGEGSQAVIEDDDTAGAGGDPLEEAGERGTRVGDEGV